MDYKFKIFIIYLYTCPFQITLVHGLAITLAKGCALGLSMGLGCLKEFSWLIFLCWDKHIYNHFVFLFDAVLFLEFSAKIITCKSCHHASCFYPKS